MEPKLCITLSTFVFTKPCIHLENVDVGKEVAQRAGGRPKFCPRDARVLKALPEGSSQHCVPCPSPLGVVQRTKQISVDESACSVFCSRLNFIKFSHPEHSV